MLRDASHRFMPSVCPAPAGGNQAFMRPLAFALAVLLATPAAAAPGGAPLGAPGTLRVSRAADERAHPRARTEAWELQAVDPRTRRAGLIRLRHAESFPSAVVTVPDPAGVQRRLEPDLVFRAGGRRGARFTGPGGSASVTWPGRRIMLELHDPEVSGRLTLSGHPGPLATGWNLGEALRYPQQRAERVTVAYNVPVAAGRVRGRLRVLGRTLRLTGWRGAFEPILGSFLF